MTDKADKVHPVVEAMARALFDHEWSPDPYPPFWEDQDEESRQYWYAHAKAAAKVLIEECAKIVERGMGFHTQVDEILESAATAIRALSSELGLEG